VDNWGEKSNWGLITRRDNAYDGKEAVRAKGADASGYRTGGEDRNYGNFIDAVASANRNIDRQLMRLISPSRSVSDSNKKDSLAAPRPPRP
jgi:hypothetical protein